jgi:hypothetical protein
MQIYVPASLLYRVQSRITLRDAKSSSRMAEITMLNTMPITIPNTMPDLFRSNITENTIPNEIPTQTRRSRHTQLRCHMTTTNHVRIKPFQSIFPTKPHEIRRRQSNNCQKRGMTVPESQPLLQTITVPEVQERSTGRYIHQLRRLAAACAPGDESTSGLRERRSVHRVK